MEAKRVYRFFKGKEYHLYSSTTGKYLGVGKFVERRRVKWQNPKMGINLPVFLMPNGDEKTHTTDCVAWDKKRKREKFYCDNEFHGRERCNGGQCMFCKWTF